MILQVPNKKDTTQEPPALEEFVKYFMRWRNTYLHIQAVVGEEFLIFCYIWGRNYGR